MAEVKKSATQQVELEGTLDWVRVFENNRDKKGPDGQLESVGGQCTLEIHLDKENEAILKAAGSNVGVKTQGGVEVPSPIKGCRIYRFKRLWQHNKFPNLGGAPQVVHADGAAWDLDTDGLIGNGSTGVILLSCYGDLGKYRGTRLEGLQVINHVPYESESTGGYTFKDRSSEVTTPASAPKSKAPANAEFMDDIPF